MMCIYIIHMTLCIYICTVVDLHIIYYHQQHQQHVHLQLLQQLSIKSNQFYISFEMYLEMEVEEEGEEGEGEGMEVVEEVEEVAGKVAMEEMEVYLIH